MKYRIEFIDLAKGICILLVIQIHVFGDTSPAMFKMFSLFRMPLYFFLSGLFFKTYDGFYMFVKKKTNKLLIPFVFCFFLTIIPMHFFFDYLIGNQCFSWYSLFLAENGRLYHDMNGAAWFLICLYFVNIIFYLIFLVSRNKISIIILFSLLSGGLGVFLDKSNVWLPIWLDTSLSALPFFAAGYFVNNLTNLLKNDFSLWHYLIFASSMLCFITISYHLLSSNLIVVEYGGNHFNVGICELYLGGISGVLCIMLLAKRIGYVPIVSFIGRYSIVVLCTHLVYLFVIRNIVYQLNMPQESVILNLMFFLIIVIVSLPTIKIGIKYLPYCFAQKDLWK